MDHVYFTTTKHEKRKHLSYDERVLIQIRLKDRWSANKIAKEIGCAPNTVRNEIRRGTVSLYSGNVKCHKAKVGQATYQQNRLACGRHLDSLEKAAFLAYVDSHIASISVKCSRQSRQTMVLSFQGYLNLKN